VTIVAVALPYEFDTVVVRGVLGVLLVVVVPGVLYSLLVSRNNAAVVALLIVAALTVYFGRLFLANLPGTKGTITASAVTVRSGRVYGIRLAGPEGTLPIRQFKAVRVESAPPPVRVLGRDHERVSLVGKDVTPTILIAETASGAGRTLGRELAASLKLPVEELSVPY
jgi:hypothetical protein